jgi:Uncharacterised nucleotidyltransferase
VVADLLTRNGWALRAHPSLQPGAWAWRHVINTWQELTFTGQYSTVDMHWRLDPTWNALPSFEEAWGRRDNVEFGGLAVPTLGLADAFAHSCHHAAKDDWRWLRSLVDVYRLAARSEVWSERPADNIAVIESTTLAVVKDCLGLPPGLPDHVVAEVDSAAGRVLRRARAAQDRPAIPTNPAPAAQSIRDARYRLSASRAPADVLRTIGFLAIPVNSVIALPDTSARTAVPRVLARRLRWLGPRIGNWARRAVRAGRPRHHVGRVSAP